MTHQNLRLGKCWKLFWATLSRIILKALANEDTLLPTKMFPRLPARATFVADTNFVSGTQKCSDFVQEHFVSATNISQFAQPKKHRGQQCVRNKVSSFARAFTVWTEKTRLVRYLLYLYCVSEGVRNDSYSRGTASNFWHTSKAKQVNLKLFLSR